MKNKGSGRIILFYLAFFLVVILVAGLLRSSGGNQKEIDYGTVVQKFQKGEIHRYYVDTDYNLYLSDTVGTDEQNAKKDAYKTYEYIHRLADVEIFTNDLSEIILQQTKEGTLVKFDYEAPSVLPWWVPYIPYVLVLIALGVFFWLFISRTSQSGGGIGIGGKMNSFSRARTKLGSDEKNKVLFSDVAGADEEKEELQEIVEFLKNPQKYTALGGKIPKGALLVGPPGTGKTLLAKALAHEGGVNFINVQSANVLSRYLGDSERALKDIFRVAKQAAPSIIFFDGIEALFPDRSSSSGSMFASTESRLAAQFTAEMRGIEELNGVTVLAATNRPDLLDKALSFDLRLELPLPDEETRAEIFRILLRKKPLAESVNLSELAAATKGMTGGDIAQICRRASMQALRRDTANFMLVMDDFMSVMKND